MPRPKRRGGDTSSSSDSSDSERSPPRNVAPDSPSTSGGSPSQSATAFVCCDKCNKWRKIPAAVADALADDVPWYCEHNPDKAFASCSIPQEMTNEEIDAESEEDDDDYDGILPKPGMLPAVVQILKENILGHRKRKQQDEDDIMICHCKPTWAGGDGCGPECINRMLCIECFPGFCPCEDKCTNQMFTRKQYSKLEVRRAGFKGFGLFALQDIKAGQFVIEYIGEVLEEEEYMRRKDFYMNVGQRHYYFMNIGNGEVIDACRKGNISRFINHSCDPNCETQKWIVKGELAIGLFALKDIAKDEELTFDYNFERYGDKPMRCYCGTKICRRYIGGVSDDAVDDASIVEPDPASLDLPPVLVYDQDMDISTRSLLDWRVGVRPDKSKEPGMLTRLERLCRDRNIVWSSQHGAGLQEPEPDGTPLAGQWNDGERPPGAGGKGASKGAKQDAKAKRGGAGADKDDGKASASGRGKGGKAEADLRADESFATPADKGAGPSGADASTGPPGSGDQPSQFRGPLKAAFKQWKQAQAAQPDSPADGAGGGGAGEEGAGKGKGKVRRRVRRAHERATNGVHHAAASSGAAAAAAGGAAPRRADSASLAAGPASSIASAATQPGGTFASSATPSVVARRASGGQASTPYGGSATKGHSWRKRSEIDRRLDTLVGPSGRLKDPSKVNIIKVLRLFNLCDIGQGQAKAAGGRAPPPFPGGLLPPAAAAASARDSDVHGMNGGTSTSAPASPQAGGEGSEVQRGGGERERDDDAAAGPGPSSAARADAGVSSARQRARMADLSLLLDVMLKTSSAMVKREFIACGLLTQLHQAVGRGLNSSAPKEFSVILRKLLRAVEGLPLTANDVFATRSAHGNFYDMLRHLSMSADYDVRTKASALLRKYPPAAVTDLRLLGPGAGGPGRPMGGPPGPGGPGMPGPPRLMMPRVAGREDDGGPGPGPGGMAGPGAGPGRPPLPPGSALGALGRSGSTASLDTPMDLDDPSSSTPGGGLPPLGPRGPLRGGPPGGPPAGRGLGPPGMPGMPGRPGMLPGGPRATPGSAPPSAYPLRASSPGPYGSGPPGPQPRFASPLGPGGRDGWPPGEGPNPAGGPDSAEPLSKRQRRVGSFGELLPEQDSPHHMGYPPPMHGHPHHHPLGPHPGPHGHYPPPHHGPGGYPGGPDGPYGGLPPPPPMHGGHHHPGGPPPPGWDHHRHSEWDQRDMRERERDMLRERDRERERERDLRERDMRDRDQRRPPLLPPHHSAGGGVDGLGSGGAAGDGDVEMEFERLPGPPPLLDAAAGITLVQRLSAEEVFQIRFVDSPGAKAGRSAAGSGGGLGRSSHKPSLVKSQVAGGEEDGTATCAEEMYALGVYGCLWSAASSSAAAAAAADATSSSDDGAAAAGAPYSPLVLHTSAESAQKGAGADGGDARDGEVLPLTYSPVHSSALAELQAQVRREREEKEQLERSRRDAHHSHGHGHHHGRHHHHGGGGHHPHHHQRGAAPGEAEGGRMPPPPPLPVNAGAGPGAGTPLPPVVEIRDLRDAWTGGAGAPAATPSAAGATPGAGGPPGPPPPVVDDLHRLPGPGGVPVRALSGSLGAFVSDSPHAAHAYGNGAGGAPPTGGSAAAMPLMVSSLTDWREPAASSGGVSATPTAPASSTPGAGGMAPPVVAPLYAMRGPGGSPGGDEPGVHYPETWDEPDASFENFVADTVRYRIGKYTQHDHPARIAHDDAQNLFRKVVREVVDKEKRAYAERQKQAIAKPIERRKLEGNIRDFVRSTIKRHHERLGTGVVVV